MARRNSDVGETLKWLLIGGAVVYGIYYINQRGGLSGLFGGNMAVTSPGINIPGIDPNFQFQVPTLSL